ncbi:MAG TPA: hypothetical protein VJU84_00460 [Pyrinomonadaceae bacterium]|nr:hypothetical protein [Pyrinomonadaceae bacterium]
MPFIDHDQETAREYLLGKLNDDQQRDFEQRVLVDDEFAEEFEVAKEELVDDYLANQLSGEESEWFRHHFLASPQGKQSLEFATTLHSYVSTNQTKPAKRSRLESLVALLNFQTAPVRAVGAFALVLIVVGVLWFSLSSGPPSYATLTLTNTAATRSAGAATPSIRLEKDILRLTLMLPGPLLVGPHYTAEIKNARGEVKMMEGVSPDGQSVILEIPASELPSGQYAIALYSKSADGSSHRIRDGYQFAVE